MISLWGMAEEWFINLYNVSLVKRVQMANFPLFAKTLPFIFVPMQTSQVKLFHSCVFQTGRAARIIIHYFTKFGLSCICHSLNRGVNTVKLTFLWYDNFGEIQTPLQRNGWHDCHSKKKHFSFIARAGSTCKFCFTSRQTIICLIICLK